MLVTCPNCGTRFNIPDMAYKPGRKARCSNCGTVFPLPPLDSFAPQGESAGFQSPAPEPPLPEQHAPRAARSANYDRPGTPQDAVPSFEDIITNVGGGGEGKRPEQAAPPKPKTEGSGKKRILLFLLAGVLTILLAGLGAYVILHAFSSPSSPQEDILKDKLKNLALTDMRQVLITNNDKIERMVVIEGKVENRSTTPKSLILLEATLMDKYGQVLAIQQQYCGITLSLFQLQVLSDEELRERLNRQSDIALANTNILPGGNVPFTIIFFNQPPAAYEFKVRIIDAQEGDLNVRRDAGSVTP